jgi:hypothetical protein
MRGMFLSEKRCVRNTLLRHRSVEFDQFEDVMIEHYSPPRFSTGGHFNLDYYLQFVEDAAIRNCRSFCARVLPNTMGAEVFVTIDKDTSRLLRMELLCGEAFPIKYFRQHIDQIEDELRRLSVSVRLGRSAYCRVFVIENDICFLAFPSDSSPVMRGEKRVLHSSAESAIECYVDSGDLVCVDGWIRTHVADSEWKLVAEVQD